MRRTLLTLGATALVAAFAATPAGAAPPEYCDPGPCIDDVLIEKLKGLTAPTVDEVVWAVRCIGDSLGGNACTGG